MKTSAVTVILAVLLAPSMASSASLGEAAKKEKERREKNKEAGVTAVRVITQDDVKTNDSPVDASGSYTSSESKANGGEPSSKSGPSDEERQWRSRARHARERVESARKRLADTPPRITRHTNRYPYQGFVTEDNPDYKHAEEELKRAETALSDLEDDARKQGVLPGWLR